MPEKKKLIIATPVCPSTKVTGIRADTAHETLRPPTATGRPWRIPTLPNQKTPPKTIVDRSPIAESL